MLTGKKGHVTTHRPDNIRPEFKVKPLPQLVDPVGEGRDEEAELIGLPPVEDGEAVGALGADVLRGEADEGEHLGDGLPSVGAVVRIPAEGPNIIFLLLFSYNLEDIES